VETKSQVQDVEWDDIAGLDDAKTALRAAIEHPIIHADLFKRYGKRSPKGVLLYGPPGCGKTLLGKAAASSMRRLHASKPKPLPVVVNPNHLGMFTFSLDPWSSRAPAKLKHEGGFFYIKAPEILKCYVGESEKKVRQIFEEARSFKKEQGYPAVVFIDEAEAILCHRSKGGSNGVMAGTIVPQFLSEMDGFDDPGCFLLLATNRPDDLDPAIVRPGRIDRRIHITRPDQAQAVAAFRIHLRSKFSTVDPVWCAQELYATQRVLYQLTGDSQRSRIVTLGDLMSGAEIAGLVERACDSAIARDIEAGSDPSGITQDDVRAAIEEVELEHRSANHFDDLFLISKAMGEQAVTVRKTAKDGSLFEVVTAKGHVTESKALN
jgi:proteasome-associated ATPase